MKRNKLSLLLTFMLICLMLPSCGSSTSEDFPEAVNEESEQSLETDTDSATTTQKDADSAYKDAKIYLSRTSFSRQRLVEILIDEEGYPEDVAEEAVSMLEDNGDVNWTAMATQTAQNYLKYVDEDLNAEEVYNALIEEDLFTEEEAQVAVDSVFH